MSKLISQTIVVLSLTVASCATACPAGYSNWTSFTVPHNASLSADVANFPYPIISFSSTTIPLIGFVFCDANNSGNLIAYLLVGGGVEEWRGSVLVSKTVDQTYWFGAKQSGTDMSNSAAVYSGFKLALLYENSGGNVPATLTDYSGTNGSVTFNGTNSNSNTSGWINGGLQISNAASTFIDTGNINAITGAFSIVTGMNCVLPSDNCNGVGFYASNNNGTNGYGCYNFNNGTTCQVVNASAESDARYTCPNGQCLSAGAWHSVVGVYNGGNATLLASWKIYQDGVSQTIAMAATGASSIGTSTNHLLVGSQGTTAHNFLTANLDDTLVFNGALSADWAAQFDFAERNPIVITLPTSIGGVRHRSQIQ